MRMSCRSVLLLMLLVTGWALSALPSGAEEEGAGAASPQTASDIAQAARGVTQLVAHRGASAECPENTLAAIRRAMAAGATAVEVDVRTTKDGVLVLSHDATVDRMTDGRGAINDLTWEEIARLDAGSKFDPKFEGEPVPRLQDALALLRAGKVDVLLDLKEQGETYARAIQAAVQTHGAPNRTIVGVRSVTQAREFRRLLPEARQIGLIPDPESIEAFAEAGVEMIRLWPKWLSDPQRVDRVRGANVALHLNGTLGTIDEIRPLLRFRPQSLSSDDPARLRQTLRALAEKQ